MKTKELDAVLAQLAEQGTSLKELVSYVKWQEWQDYRKEEGDTTAELLDSWCDGCMEEGREAMRDLLCEMFEFVDEETGEWKED